MIMDEDESIQVPIVYDFSLDYLDEQQEDVILDKRIKNSQWGDLEYLWVGIKGVKPNKAKWIKAEKVREIYPQLVVE